MNSGAVQLGTAWDKARREIAVQKLVEKQSVHEANRRRRRGYDTNHLPEKVRQELKSLEATSLSASIMAAIGGYSVIIASVLITHWVWQTNPIWGAIAYAAAILIVARQQRVLELMVHDASHWSWQRQNRSLNDKLADAIVATPSMSTVSGYRRSHFIHHGQFAGDLDPCRKRFAEMGLGLVDLSTRWAITKAVLRWLPQYNLAYYKEIGSKSLRILASWAAWHGLVFVAPAAILLGIADAAVLWMMCWLLPSLVVLPVIRSIAEAEEHDYGRGETEFEATFTNNGLLHHILWHPWNDAYHQIHHMFPNISQRHHHKVHRLLMEHDPIYRASLFRTHTLEQLPTT